jgi:hypothetical protein
MKSKLVLDIEEQSIDFPEEGLYFMLIFQQKVFPHLAILNQGKYWSLSLNQVYRAVPGLQRWKSLRRKLLPVIFIKINSEKSDEDLLRLAFSGYNPLHLNQQTCLSPVLDFFRLKTGQNIQAEIVADLVLELSRLSYIQNYLAINIQSGPFCLPDYSRQDVVNSIHG